MNIESLFQRLSWGELSNLAVGIDGTGGIREEKWPQIISFVNEGLLRLHSRFILKQKEVIIEQVGNLTRYVLDRKFAQTTGANVTHRYIKDFPQDPYLNDAIKILAVYNDCGHQLPLNDAGNRYSLFTPSPLVLQVPHPRDGRPLSVVCQARHPELSTSGEDVLNQEIDLPSWFEGALQAFVAGKVFTAMMGQENQASGANYLATFEQICAEIGMTDMANETIHTTHSKLEQRGFV